MRDETPSSDHNKVHSKLIDAIRAGIQSAVPKSRSFKRQQGGAEVGGTYLPFNTAGQWDIWGFIPVSRHFEIEVKTGTGTLTKEQKKWHAVIASLGVFNRVVHAQTMEDVDRAAAEAVSWLKSLVDVGHD